MKKIYIISTTLFLAILPIFMSAQRVESTTGLVKIKIDATINGKSTTIDTTIDVQNAADIQSFLNTLGFDENLNQMQIDLTDAPTFTLGDSALKSIQLDLNTIDMPEMAQAFGANKAVLGIRAKTVDEGAQIYTVAEKSAADEAGLKAGDIIIKIDDRTVESNSNLTEIIGKYDTGNKITITYLRNKETKTTTAILQENTHHIDITNFDITIPDILSGNDQESDKGFLGIYMSNIDAPTTLSGVEKNSAAEEAGLKKGDVITAIDNIAVNTFDDIATSIASKKPGDAVSITYMRNGKSYSCSAILQGRNMLLYNAIDDNDISPNMMIDKVISCPGKYTYTTADSGTVKKICITINADAPTAPSAPAEPPAPLPHNSWSGDILQFYPNPTDGTFTLAFTLAQAGDTYIHISNMDGKEVYHDTLKNFKGTYSKVIHLNNVPGGNYIIQLSQNDMSITKQIILQ